ncbi:MAG: isoprenylcysteine carboxylmethyltransferase family protein [Planctomycetaceae bacterium]|nr:isoprenylcysteine carboxylmethyltransferase family protein [Planctomycetaceae bacterium]
MSTPVASSSSASTVVVPSDAGRRLWEIACNVVLSLLFLKFAIQQGEALLATWRISTALMLAKVSTDVVFYLIRKIPKGVSISLYDWMVGIVGTYAIVLFRAESAGRDQLVGQVLQFGGIGLQVLAMLSLNRSIGMVAANRGIKTGGLYRFVRHPLYLSYVVAFLGYTISHPTSWNVGVYAAAVALWVLRLLTEERFLLQDPQYQEYSQRVRSRLIPGVF